MIMMRSEMNMKILIIKGSPHIKGSSNLLTSQFIKGVQENHHEVTEFDVAHHHIAPCLGCEHCGMDGPCVQKDDMNELKELMLSHDVIVFVSPLYYFGISAQLKAAIDRIYSFTMKLSSMHKKTVFICAAWNSSKRTMDAVEAHYQALVDYMHFEDLGMILATGCGTPSMTSHSAFMKQAYELGKSID